MDLGHQSRTHNTCGFGAIEGALGSFYKIDASYLSPNVNMSNKLEELTKTYNS